MLELPTRNGHPAGRARRTDKVAVERVAAVQRPFAHRSQVRRDGAGGRRLAAKTRKLGMVTVAVRRTPQQGLSQESLAPQRDKPPRVEVLRVQTPDRHTTASVTDPVLGIGAEDG